MNKTNVISSSDVVIIRILKKNNVTKNFWKIYLDNVV